MLIAELYATYLPYIWFAVIAIATFFIMFVAKIPMLKLINEFNFSAKISSLVKTLGGNAECNAIAVALLILCEGLFNFEIDIMWGVASGMAASLGYLVYEKLREADVKSVGEAVCEAAKTLSDTVDIAAVAKYIAASTKAKENTETKTVDLESEKVAAQLVNVITNNQR